MDLKYMNEQDQKNAEILSH
jgi:hypothetical protein